MSKGSSRRPGAGYADNWERIFATKANPKISGLTPEERSAIVAMLVPTAQYLEDHIAMMRDVVTSGAGAFIGGVRIDPRSMHPADAQSTAPSEDTFGSSVISNPEYQAEQESKNARLRRAMDDMPIAPKVG